MLKVKNNNNRLAFIEGWISVIVNTLLFALKYWAGMVTGSVAIIADAWHTLSDSVTSIIVIVGAKASNKPPDKKHPFGHGRSEIIGSIVIGVLLAVVAFDFILESINKLKGGETTNFGTIALVVTIISILMKEGMAQYAFWGARRTNSKSLKADGWHHRSDAFSSGVILIGIFLGPYLWWMDGAMGIIIACLLFYGTYQILKDAIGTLLGEDTDQELIAEVKKMAIQCCQSDLNLHHFHLHNYGNHQELTFHIKLDGNLSLVESHEIATLLEKKIKAELDITSTIHIEPLN
ncbi:MAG: cation transporter [Bacteroidetes bacterium]|nr:cation transporter [Bacteroidota bacterium]